VAGQNKHGSVKKNSQNVSSLPMCNSADQTLILTSYNL